MADSGRKLRVGIIGAGLVAQVNHLPTLSQLNHLFTIAGICDVSKTVLEHTSQKYHIPLSTQDPSVLICSAEIDVIFVLTSDPFHEPLTISALQAGKHVLLEKPASRSIPSVERMISAERISSQSTGARIFMGYMRRHAPNFTKTFAREVKDLVASSEIRYARVRDFPGPNERFVDESGTFLRFPEKGEIGPEARKEGDERLEKLLREAFPEGEMTDERRSFCQFLGSLGSHDISLMREILGNPESVAAVAVNDPFYSAMFNYRNKDGSRFAVTYESGWDQVLDFDAHLAIYTGTKRVMIKYDSPFVKGLPIKVVVQEVNAETGEMETRELLSSYEDAFTAELKELYECLINGKPIKTTIEDALNDLKIYDMMYRKWEEGKA